MAKEEIRGRWLPGSGPTKCAACGEEFQDHRQRSRRTPFCSPPCAKAALVNAQVAGDAIVELRNDGVFCILCKKLFQVAGTHFSRVHGLDTSATSTKSERQAAYGLPQGSRLASLAVLEDMSRRAIDSGFSELGNKGCKPSPIKRPTVSKHSAAQRLQAERLGKLGAEWCAREHEESLVDWQCQTCGKQERRQRSRARHRYCSLKCRPVSEVVVKMLKAHTVASHERAIEEKTRACAVCGKTFVPASKKARGVRCCSPACVGALRTKPRPPCARCERPSRVHGLCTKHYQQERPLVPCGVCAGCGTPILAKPGTRGRKFCSVKCAGAAQKRDSLPCVVCSLPAIARGLCPKHYAAARRQPR